MSHRRRRRTKAEPTSGFAQRPFRTLRLPFAPTNLLSEDELESIHHASLTLLEETGIDVLHERARDFYRAAGADVDAQRVRLAPELVMGQLAHCPEQFTLHARNPEHNVVMGANHVAFSLVASPPNCSDLARGRRAGNQADFRDLLKLAQMHNIIHLIAGYPVEPVDLSPRVRHLHCLRDMAVLTDKVFHAYSLGVERNLDGIEIARLARGISEEQMRREPSLLSVINTNSPLQLDIPMMEGILQMAKYGQALVITPFTLAGAMAPVTIAGALVQQNAEALAAITFAQLVNPGTPVIYGGFTSNVDMKSGAPAFGTPEYMQAQLVGGQLARRYKIPYRTSNVCAANSVDAQSAYESVFSLWGAIQGGGNLIKHAAGWLEGGLCASFEKVIIDIDLLQMLAEFLQPLDVSSQALGLDAIQEVGPGGHFFAAQHTKERYRNAFYTPIISDWRNFESWQEAGSPTAATKAHATWKARLQNYQAPTIDPAISEALDDFVARRIAQGGVRDY